MMTLIADYEIQIKNKNLHYVKYTFGKKYVTF